MAELSMIETPCCTLEELATCCDPEEEAECCGPAFSACDCATDQDVDDVGAAEREEDD
jgi:hypothetical protein